MEKHKAQMNGGQKYGQCHQGQTLNVRPIQTGLHSPLNDCYEGANGPRC